MSDMVDSNPDGQQQEMARLRTQEQELNLIVPGLVALIGGIICTIMIAVPIENMLSGDAWLVAPIGEEPAKMAGLVFLALFMPFAIRTKKDGLVLGALAGLGFTFLENLIYMIQGADMFVRTFICSPGHIAWSAIVGMGVALAAVKISQHRSASAWEDFKYGFLSADVLTFLGIGMVLHGIYDGFVGQIISLGNLPLDGLAIVIASIYVAYKLYSYLPGDLAAFRFPGPIALVSNALKSRPTTLSAAPVPLRAMAASEPAPAPARSPAIDRIFCTQCGAENRAGSRFCSNCGNKMQ